MLPWCRAARHLTPWLLCRRQLSQGAPRYYAAKVELPEYDYNAAREWFKNYKATESLHGLGEVTYSRSSGPGGQNVNKVNSKAQLRVPVDRLFEMLPAVLHKGLLASRYYAQNSSSLVVQADDSRKQQANKEACYRKLNELIVDVYKHNVPGETTKEQKEKVQKLQKAENEARLKRKHLHSSKKQSRSKGDIE
ncbi:hypothetical protein LTR20_005008 [Exophiala xenobiotica]|nr:hypothetical protein LTS13_000933 [Exophiala xenobiotica]KAK5398085.1 hypothetical protein LTR79_004367 [Exophiala xenobiotica]KAK5417845.1 hypothetical protein LTR90_005019 [Exophiala xenobiotica]KAK5464302.1 hypothetical protein LTR20_005008 [Exophiala xenobiotica]KAK5498061.1 hypothetical protein LTR26_001461 [Exophiala xenobiotica]